MNMKRFYLQVNSDNIITDAIEYAVEGYIEYETNDVLPIGLIGGQFKYENGIIVEYPQLKPAPEIELKERINLLEQALNELLLGGGE
jgi:hypothetical protein